MSAQEPLLQRFCSPVAPEVSKTVRVAGHEVEVWNDEKFAELRRAHGVADSFLDNVAGSTEAFVDFSTPRAETRLGKGGEAQFITMDRQFVVKAVSVDDHATLLRIAGAYVERLLQEKTLLCPIYLHFRVLTSGKRYLAMRNLTPLETPWDAKYDLKGCDDDKTLEFDGRAIEPVRRRFYRVDRWCRCAWTSARWRYFEGKQRARQLRIELPTEQRNEVVDMIVSDAEWLASQQVMDYSLLIAVRSFPADSQLEPGITDSKLISRKHNGASHRLHRPRPPLAYSFAVSGESQGQGCILTLGIIDFLQSWTATKQVAMCLKFLEENKSTVPPEVYGARFKRHFSERLQASSGLRAVPLGPMESATALPAVAPGVQATLTCP